MDFLAIIPARYGSSRFPGKPLAEIDGIPMIEHVRRRTSAVYRNCWVATDDPRISRTVERFGGRAVLTSPNHRSGTDRCAEALEIIEAAEGKKFDVVVNVQGDEPFLAEEHLRAIMRPFGNAAACIATLVKPFGPGEDIFNPNIPKVAYANGRALWFSRSAIPYLRGRENGEWQRSYPYMKHIGMYAYRTDVLRSLASLPAGTLEAAESLEQLRWLENGYCIMAEVTHAETMAVDTPDDLNRITGHIQALKLHDTEK